MLEPQNLVCISWLFFEAAAFATTLYVAYRLGRRAKNLRVKASQLLGSLAVYSIAVFGAYSLWIGVGSSYTLFGAALYGGIAAGFHTLLMAMALVAVWRIVN